MRFITPSVWTVYRSRDTASVSRGTWLLIFGELLCWGVFGIHEADPRLIVLGATGVVASVLVLARVSWPRAAQAPATHLVKCSDRGCGELVIHHSGRTEAGLARKPAGRYR